MIDGAIGIYHIGLVEELPKPWQPAPAHIRVRVDSESTIGVFVARELLASVERDGARDRCNFGSCCQLALDVLSGLQPLEEIACFALLALRRSHCAPRKSVHEVSSDQCVDAVFRHIWFDVIQSNSRGNRYIPARPRCSSARGTPSAWCSDARAATRANSADATMESGHPKLSSMRAHSPHCRPT